MDKYTKQSPGSGYDMYKYLEEISGISSRKEIEIKTIEGLRRKTASKVKNKTVLKFQARDIVAVINGERIPYMLGQSQNIRFDAQYKDPPEKFLVSVHRQLDEFGVEISPAGLYNNCLGGGWSEKVQLYRVNGKYFAPGI